MDESGYLQFDFTRCPNLYCSPGVRAAPARTMKILPFVSPLLFLLACGLPCLELTQKATQQDIMLGLRALAIGWSGIFAGIVSWYANPIWLVSVVLGSYFNKPIMGAAGGALALAVGLTTRSVVGRELPADEGNVNKMTVVRVRPGFYVWLGSFVALIVVSLLQMVLR